MENYRLEVTPDVLARFNKQNKEIMKHVEWEDGVMYLSTAYLMDLGIPYIHTKEFPTVQPKEVIRIITENSIELKNHFDLFKRLLSEMSPHFYFNDVKPDNKCAELQTPSMVLEFCVKNCEQDTDADYILNNTNDPDHFYYQLKKVGLKALDQHK
ncbi:hypothetical protein [Paenibacillus tianjinensis]|uniref:Uncharacterized protein n=1 Tax=Paenibacillus tianjinensis TaxID=2810347 RepID=A0ABX7L8B5_9BACL|nr:hypothetical protein [Paenibacillus tianjinensis]QSF43249.1 hypothetical protein JRJ22_18455 [Paenibacillus tianjinensis]